MKRKCHIQDQIILKLREVETLHSGGSTLADAAKRLGVSEMTLIRWRNAFGGLKGQDMRELKELERENLRLRMVVADLALDIEMLKEVAKGNF